MSWSLKIGRIRGIDLRVHVTFLFIVALFAFQYRDFGSNGWQGALFGLLYVLLLFACVVLHELGHSLVAQRFGVKVRDITLWPIGGVARMEEIPRKPGQELLVAIAGPAVNFVIAAILGTVLIGLFAVGALGDIMRLPELMSQPSWETLLLYLFATNLGLGLFNLIPAFPMDGGRVLRSLLALGLPYVQATRVAVGVGQGIALLLGLAGLLIPGQFTLVLIAGFIFFGAGQEGQMTAARELLGGLTVRQAASRPSVPLSPYDRLSRAVDLTLSSHQADFLVVDGERLLGVLSRDALLSSLKKQGPDTTVREAMCVDHPSVGLDESLLVAQQRMASASCQALAVMEQDLPVGLLTLADINEAYTLMAISPQAVVRRQS